MADGVLRELRKRNGKIDYDLYLSLRRMFYRDFSNDFFGESDIRIRPNRIIQKGGKIFKYRIDDKIYNISVDKIVLDDKNENSSEEFELRFFTMDDFKHVCGILLIYKDEAIIQDVINMENCILDEKMKDVEKRGNLILKMMIKVCKKLKIKTIKLSDNSYHSCKNGSKIDLIEARTMTDGYPYYKKYGFTPIDNLEKKIMKKNYIKMSKLKTSDINLQKIVKDEEIIDYILSYQNDKLSKTLKHLMYNYCEVFAKIYKKIYKRIGLDSYPDKTFFLKL
jgi:hypothetical protein